MSTQTPEKFFEEVMKFRRVRYTDSTGVMTLPVHRRERNQTRLHARILHALLNKKPALAASVVVELGDELMLPAPLASPFFNLFKHEPKLWAALHEQVINDYGYYDVMSAFLAAVTQEFHILEYVYLLWEECMRLANLTTGVSDIP